MVRSVIMASNFVGVGTMDEVQWWDKKQWRFFKVSRPEVVKLYNEAMGGVDLLNQLVSLYRTEIRSRKWTLRMITHAFDLAVVNSWLEYRLDTKRAISRWMWPSVWWVSINHWQQNVEDPVCLQNHNCMPTDHEFRMQDLYLKCSMIWLTTCRIMMRRKRPPDARGHTAQGKHMYSVTNATSTFALCHTETAHRKWENIWEYPADVFLLFSIC